MRYLFIVASLMTGLAGLSDHAVAKSPGIVLTHWDSYGYGYNCGPRCRERREEFREERRARRAERWREERRRERWEWRR